MRETPFAQLDKMSNKSPSHSVTTVTVLHQLLIRLKKSENEQFPRKSYGRTQNKQSINKSDAFPQITSASCFKLA